MTRFVFAVIGTLVLLVCTCETAQAFSEQCALQKPPATVEPLRRGVNLGGWWWGKREMSFDEHDFQNIKSLGFDFVRLPVSEKFLSLSDKETLAKELARLRCGVVSLLNSGLVVVFDFHPSREYKENLKDLSEDATLARVVGNWKVLAKALEGLPHDRVLLCIFNEPPWHLKSWWKIQGRLLMQLRAFFPYHTMIATDIMGGHGGWEKKIPYNDPNLMYEFHFYKPKFFTHHFADWKQPAPDPREKTDQIKYPSALEKNADSSYEAMVNYKKEGWDKTKLAQIIDKPVTWSRRTGAKVLCLEFGVYKPYVDPDSRNRWIKDVREILEERNVPWAVWDYNLRFGVVDKNGDMSAAMVEALGLIKTKEK